MAPLDPVSDQFAILPICMPPVPSYPKSALHEIRVRRDAPKIPTPHDDRSLFLKNIPIDSTEPHFRAVFTSLVGAGRFEGILFDDETTPALPIDPAQLPQIWTRRLHTSGGMAVVLLADEKSVQLVLRAIAKLHKTHKYPVWGEGLADRVPPLGAPWISSHLHLCRGDKVETQSAVYSFFNVFNGKKKEAAELAKKLRNEPDEDGFVTVTRGGRATLASRAEAEEAKQRMADRQTKKKSELRDFYRFQLRERRKLEQAALLGRFEADKRKVEAMRKKRGKFKPER